jgi:hypothetical protein
MAVEFLSLSQPRGKFQGTHLIKYTVYTYNQIHYFSTFSKYDALIYLVYIDILRTYSSAPSSESHVHVHKQKYIFS